MSYGRCYTWRRPLQLLSGALVCVGGAWDRLGLPGTVGRWRAHAFQLGWRGRPDPSSCELSHSPGHSTVTLPPTHHG